MFELSSTLAMHWSVCVGVIVLQKPLSGILFEFTVQAVQIVEIRSVYSPMFQARQPDSLPMKSIVFMVAYR